MESFQISAESKTDAEKMLGQNVRADQDQYDAARNRGFVFVFQTESVPDENADQTDDQRRNANDRRRCPDRYAL